MLLRAAHDFVGEQGYSSPLLHSVWANHQCTYGFVGGAAQNCTALQVCYWMKINLFPHDKATKLIREIVCKTGSPLRRTINTYLISRCTSHEFLEAFLTTGAWKAKSLKKKLEMVIAHFRPENSFRCFTRSFQPQRGIRNTLLKLRRQGKHIAMKKMFRSLFRAPSPLLLKDGSHRFRSKVDICKDIRCMHGLGVFGSKNFWQYYKMGVTYPNSLDKEFGEVPSIAT